MSKKRPIMDRLQEQEPPSTPSTASPLRRRHCHRPPKEDFDEADNVSEVHSSDTNSGDSYNTGIPADAASDQTARIYQTALEMLANVSLRYDADQSDQEHPSGSLATDSNTTPHSSSCQSPQKSTSTQQTEGSPQEDSNEKKSESSKLDSNKLQGASTSMTYETQKLCSSSAQPSSISRRNDCDATQRATFSLEELPSTSKSAQAKKYPPRETKAVKVSPALRPKRGAETFDEPQTSFGSKASRNDSNQLDSSCPQNISSSAQAMRPQTLDASTQTLQEDQTSNEGQTQSVTLRGGSDSAEGTHSSSSNYNFLVNRINDNQLNIIVLANEFTIEEPVRNHLLITVQSSVGENDDRTSVNTQSDFSTNAQFASSNSEQFGGNMRDESRSWDSTSPLPLTEYISSTEVTDANETPSMDSNTLESTCSLPHTLRQVSERLYQETDEEQELENMSQLEVTIWDNVACTNGNDDPANATDYQLSETSEANTSELPASTYQPRSQTQTTTAQLHCVAAASPAVVPTRRARYQAPQARPHTRRRRRRYSSWSNQLQHRNMVSRVHLTRPDYKTVVVSAGDTSSVDQTFVSQPHFRAQDFPRRNPRTVPRIHETTSRVLTESIAHRWEQSSTYQGETRLRRLSPQFIQSIPIAFETRAPRLSLPSTHAISMEFGILSRLATQENLSRELISPDITAWLGSSCPIPSLRIPIQNRELLAMTFNNEPIIITMLSRFTVLCLNEYQTIIRISPTRPQGVTQHNDRRGNSIRTSTNATFFGSENMDFTSLEEQSQELSIFILNDDYRITSTVPGFPSTTLVGNRLFLSRIPSTPMPQQFMRIYVRGSAQHVTFERERIDRLLSATLPQIGERSEFSIRRIVDSLACLFSIYFSDESTTDLQRLDISNPQVTEVMQVDDDTAEGIKNKSPEQITDDTPSTSNAARLGAYSSAQSSNRSQNMKISRRAPRLGSANETLNLPADISLLETSESSNAQTHIRPQQTPAANAGQATKQRRRKNKGKGKRK
ncbi:uncharacterized protein LOC101455191 [Ceratitis capitata]|uniref:(Mediterranean fruit fly) hypothetical protein n=1 Tax=Ceratitis capitata TaxID=7213 RepID=A0A811VK29_CERCA|nr:uncharacterized protein LOC101455191 [Ceratitis capitata]XP_004535910.1 uncharacterized protein LOC101455191 [Ceratitis capitata]XP_020717117.1 uncharacterized protein LOC101455191 [Ceratitis capitata]CAD7014452.1 unnamed protein product [Ceratitis capitata]